MTKSLFVAAAAIFCLAPAAFAASDTDPAASPAAAPATTPGAKAKAKDSDIVCKYQQPIGSRLGGKRVCMSRYDWQQQSNRARDDMSYRTPTPGMNPH